MVQRKLTEPVESGAGLPDLTPNQAKFVEGILAGKTASDAYRAAYDCSGSQDKTIWARASELRRHSNVEAWLTAARMAGLGTGKVTLEGHIQELERLKEIAINSGNVGAAVQAEQLRGKAMGHYTEKLEVHNSDPVASLKELQQTNPELAALIAKKHGVDLQ